MADAVKYIGGMFGAGNIPIVTDMFIYNLRSYAMVILIGIFAATPIPKILVGKLSSNGKFRSVWNIAEVILLALLLLLVTAYLADGAFNPFLYFRF